MDVEVSIERDKDGRLHGYVIERYEALNGDEAIRKGDDLLKKRVFKHVDNACSECAGHLHGINKTSSFRPLNIKFHYPDGK